MDAFCVCISDTSFEIQAAFDMYFFHGTVIKTLHAVRTASICLQVSNAEMLNMPHVNKSHAAQGHHLNVLEVLP